jgi:hypothetical protein
MWVQVTALWGDGILRVWRVDTSRGFRVGPVDCDYLMHLEEPVIIVPKGRVWSPGSSVASAYRDGSSNRVAVGDVTFEVEPIDEWTEPLRLRQSSPRATMALVFSAALHAAIAAIAMFAHPAPESVVDPGDPASIDQLRAMQRYLMTIAERDEEIRYAGCTVGDDCPPLPDPRKRMPYSSLWSMWWWWDEGGRVKPEDPDGCAAFGDFWVMANECGTWPSTLSSRLVTDTLANAHAHRKPTMKLGVLRVDGSAAGGTSLDVIDRKVHDLLPRLQRCYERSHNVEGVRPVSFTIAPDGHVSTATTAFDLDPTSFAGCIAREIDHLKFPKQPGKVVVFDSLILSLE